MAFTFNVNQTPATGAVCVYSIISTLVAAGWSKIKDSDGSTYSSSGTQVTSGNAFGNGLNNNYAWIIVQAPTVGSNQRSFCFQRGAGTGVWRIKYSANAGFTGGTASATQTPSAADEIVICGTGTNASPNFGYWLSDSISRRLHIICGGSDEFYSFVAFSTVIASGAYDELIFLDVLATGSFSPLDPDPAVTGVNSGECFKEILNSYGNSYDPQPAIGWLGATNNISNAVPLSLSSFGGLTPFSNNSYAANPFSGKEILLPLFWYRQVGRQQPVGTKGLSSLFRINSNVRTNMDVFNLIGTRDVVYFQNIVLPWDGSIPTI